MKKNKIKIKLFLLKFFLKKRKGTQKKVIDIILNEYEPINDNICIDSVDQDHEQAMRFQGKPVSKLPLKNSNMANTKENSKIK